MRSRFSFLMHFCWKQICVWLGVASQPACYTRHFKPGSGNCMSLIPSGPIRVSARADRLNKQTKAVQWACWLVICYNKFKPMTLIINRSSGHQFDQTASLTLKTLANCWFVEWWCWWCVLDIIMLASRCVTHVSYQLHLCVDYWSLFSNTIKAMK